MGEVLRAFETRREQVVRPPAKHTPDAAEQNLPWRSVKAGEMPPIMFQLRLRTGERLSLAYGDLREVGVRDAGCIRLGLMGMSPILITLEGRHLNELAESFGCGLIQWVREADERDLEPESSPSIGRISLEPYPKNYRCSSFGKE